MQTAQQCQCKTKTNIRQLLGKSKTIRRALCPGRVRSCHHPSSHVPGCSFCSFYSFLSIPGAIGSKSVLPDGYLAAPWWSAVMGRDFFFLALAREKLHSAACERTGAPSTCITSAILCLLGPIFHYIQYFFLFR